MNYSKIILATILLTSFSQLQAQDVDPKQKKKFEKIDANNDNGIDLDELSAFYKGKKKKNGKDFDAAKMFAKKDADNNGKLTLQEFVNKGKKKKS
ncbi:EF-hand domain-containing protein [Aquimarina algicola]|nr:EF-hand domain-containing protein [Aquimarina algicola]